MSAQINIVKRNGTIVPYNPERINTFLEFVCDGLEDVSLSQIAVNSDLYIYDGITTKEINRALLESAHNLISVDNPGYAIAAGRIYSATFVKKCTVILNHMTCIPLLKIIHL